MDDLATYFAWLVMGLLSCVAIAMIVAVGSLPKKIAIRRNHPQVAAINPASWIGLALGGLGWTIAFVWAFPHDLADDHTDSTTSSSERENAACFPEGNRATAAKRRRTASRA